MKSDDSKQEGHKSTECRKCGVGFDYKPVEFAGREVYIPELCPVCARQEADTEKRQAAAAKLAERSHRWAKTCPSSYDTVDIARLPHPGLLVVVLEWRPGPRGLLLAGASSTGKTRCAWQLLKREHFLGRRVAAVSCYDVVSYSAKLMSASQEAHTWLESVARAELTLMDDVFKAKMTDRAKELLFTIVDERVSRGRPIVATMNETSDSIQSKMGDDSGPAVVARLRNFCELVQV